MTQGSKKIEQRKGLIDIFNLRKPDKQKPKEKNLKDRVRELDNREKDIKKREGRLLDIAVLNKQKAKLQAEIKKGLEELRGINKKLNSLERVLSSREKVIVMRERNLNNRELECRKMEKAAGVQKQFVDVKKHELAELEQSILRMQGQADELGVKLSAQQRNIEQAVKTLYAKKESLNSEIENIRKERDKVKNEYEGIKEEIAENKILASKKKEVLNLLKAVKKTKEESDRNARATELKIEKLSGIEAKNKVQKKEIECTLAEVVKSREVLKKELEKIAIAKQAKKELKLLSAKRRSIAAVIRKEESRLSGLVEKRAFEDSLLDEIIRRRNQLKMQHEPSTGVKPAAIISPTRQQKPVMPILNPEREIAGPKFAVHEIHFDIPPSAPRIIPAASRDTNKSNIYPVFINRAMQRLRRENPVRPDAEIRQEAETLWKKYNSNA